ncbi:MAG: hypothetical protein ACPGXK_14335 [Phycisphaerae bacterium]
MARQQGWMPPNRALLRDVAPDWRVGTLHNKTTQILQQFPQPVRQWMTPLVAGLCFVNTACIPPTGVCDRVRSEEAALRVAFDEFVEAEALTEAEVQALVLDEFAIELEIVLAAPATYTTDATHPLIDLIPGTDAVRQNRDFLNGCWGRIEFEEPFASDEEGEVEVKTAEAMRIDLRDDNALSLRLYRLEGVDGMPCTEDDRPVARRTFATITEVSDIRYSLIVDNAVAAGVTESSDDEDNTPDRMLDLHQVGSIQASLTIATTGETLFIVDDDHLVTTEAGFDVDNPQMRDLDFWVRFDCVR